MIAGKTESEILAMKYRWLWYKTISPELKEEAMMIVETVRRAKISAANTVRVVSEKTKAKQRAAWTPEKKAAKSMDMSGENNHMYGKMSGENNPMKRSEVKAAHKVTMGKFRAENNPSKRPEVRAKISASQTGNNNSFFGKTHTEKTKATISADMAGGNNPNWQGGKSFEPYGIEFNIELKKQIRSRDNHTCQECHQTEEQLGRALDVHHIDYDKKNNIPENLISLCHSCHAQTNYSREGWTEYFGTYVPRLPLVRGDCR